MVTEEVALADTCRYDRLKNWTNVQDQILDILRNRNEGYDITIPKDIQLLHTLRVLNPVQSILLIRCHTLTQIVTQCNMGAINVVQVWDIANGTQDVKTYKFQVKPDIVKMIFIAKHRVFAAYCKDMTLRVFTDCTRGFAELSVTSCPHNILCLAYNRQRDILLTGGVGCLIKWNFAEYREKLTVMEPYDVPISKQMWVTNVRIDHKSKTLLIQMEEKILIFNYKNSKVTHEMYNRHTRPLTCTATYPPLDYFITASRDGNIKIWNSTVFGLMFEFVGHFDDITGLLVHPLEPLLISSSLDGTIRIWRLDTFEVYKRIDVGERIQGIWLINPQELAFYTETEVKIFKLNMYLSLYSPTQSSVYHMERVKVAGFASRIIISAEDGSVRMVNPTTGEVLTIIYPMASFKVLTDLVYHRQEDKIFVAMGKGEVIVFSCLSNPCQAAYRLIPDREDTHILCLTLVHVDHHWEKDRVYSNDGLVFAGHRDGTISLLHSEKYIMHLPVQAHQGETTVLATSKGLRRYNETEIGWFDRLLSGGTDSCVKVWAVGKEDSPPARNTVTLTLLKIVPCEGVPVLVSMQAQFLAVALRDKGRIWMYEMGADIARGTSKGVREIPPHSIQDAHTQQVNALDCCPSVGLFASTGEDGTIKIWGLANHLLREMDLGDSLHSMCFANDRSDILLGVHGHVFSISLVNYLPLSVLETMVLKDFKIGLVEACQLNLNDTLSMDNFGAMSVRGLKWQS